MTSLARTIRLNGTLLTENRDPLVKLDYVSEDGDLGISMDDGVSALAAYFRG